MSYREIRQRSVAQEGGFFYPWNHVEPDMIEAEEEVMLDILADNNMLIDRKS